MANEREKAQAIVALVLAIAQVLIAFGIAAGNKILEVVDANQAVLLGFLAAVFGIIQSWLPSITIRRKKQETTDEKA